MPVVYRAMTGADHAGVSVLLAERLPGVQIEALRLYRGYVAVEDNTSWLSRCFTTTRR